MKYLVEWESHNNETFPPDWIDEKDISVAALREYKESLKFVRRAVDVRVPLDPVHDLVGRRLLHKLAEVMNSTARPGEYLIDVPELSFTALACGYLELISRPRICSTLFRSLLEEGRVVHPGDRHLIKEVKRGSTLIRDLAFRSMADVFHVCSFHRFYPQRKAIGCFRFGKRRGQNIDFTGLGPYLSFSVVSNERARVVGACKFQVHLCIVKVNGVTGEPDFGLWQSSNPMAQVSTRDAFVKHAKTFIPRDHPLFLKGWHLLPTQGRGCGSWSLPLDVAMPGPCV